MQLLPWEVQLLEWRNGYALPHQLFCQLVLNCSCSACFCSAATQAAFGVQHLVCHCQARVSAPAYIQQCSHAHIHAGGACYGSTSQGVPTNKVWCVRPTGPPMPGLGTGRPDEPCGFSTKKTYSGFFHCVKLSSLLSADPACCALLPARRHALLSLHAAQSHNLH